jgi:hypothetical protein
VGVWLAAVRWRHVHQPVAAEWFGRETDDIAFCRVTQMGLVRLLSNPAIMGDDAIDRSQAWRVYDQLWADERVRWADEPVELDAVWRAISARDDKSHKLWTDDYLASFAQASDATLITLDRKVASRYPSVRVEVLLLTAFSCGIAVAPDHVRAPRARSAHARLAVGSAPPGPPAPARSAPQRPCGRCGRKIARRATVSTPDLCYQETRPPVARLGRAALDTRPHGNPSALVFPGQSPARPAVDVLFGVRLRRYGIDAHAGHATARLALAAELPASVLADLTGISVSTAERWFEWAKRDWAGYLGQRKADDRGGVDSQKLTNPTH